MKGVHTLHAIDEPEWMKVLAPNSLVCSSDVARLFKFKNLPSLHSSVAAGSFPKPDRKLSKVGRPYVFVSYWRADTLRREIARRLDKKRTYDENRV